MAFCSTLDLQLVKKKIFTQKVICIKKSIINWEINFLKIAHLKEHRGMPTVEDTPRR